MDIYESIDFVSRIIGVAANCAVAMACILAYRVLRWPSIALIGISALLGVFCEFVISILMPGIPDEFAYNLIWVGYTVLISVDLVLYGAGVWFLLKRILSTNL